MTHKQQILEPITAISRLITLAFKPKYTKIAIRNHNIILCEPTEDYFGFHISQSINRYINHDSRNDIVVLNHVMYNFIEWYIIPYKTTKHIYDKLINLMKYLCVGLNELQITYKIDNACFTIQYYINILSALVDDTFHNDMIYHSTDTEDTKYSTILNVNKLKSFWAIDDVILLIEQFDKCFTNVSYEEKKIKYCKDYWPVSKNITDDIVQGYIVGITNVLNTMDKRFTACINHSIKG